MKDGWYIACPVCLELSKGEGWTALYKERHKYDIEIKEENGEVEIDYQPVEVTSTMHDYTKHKCGFLTYEWTPEELMVKIENGKIVDLGDYWYLSPLTELTKLMVKNGLLLDKERVLR